MMILRKAILPGLVIATALICGCQDKVITVADFQEAEEQSIEYIEMKEFTLKDKEEDSGRAEVQCCAVLIPSGYYESEEVPGMYLHERAPLDSSNVYYTVSEGSGDGVVSDSLTEQQYRKAIEDAFDAEGRDISLEVDSFEEIDMDGVPAYKIRSSYDTGDNRIEQLTYLILAEDTYTITYSQSEDDELMADFEVSDGEIRLVKEEAVQMAEAE